MNRHQVVGTAKNVAGRGQQKVGEVIGSKTQQAKGLARQVEGKMQKGMGNVEEAMDRQQHKAR
jgi:uncharacterized protein YjbJ (UPF0337 family)